MVKPFEFAVDTDLALGLKALLQQLDRARAQQAMAGYVGNLDYLRMNLRDVLGKARQWRLAKPAA